MKMSLLRRSLITWVLFIPFAILNGIIRELGYAPYMGTVASHQFSTVIATLAFLLLVGTIMRKSLVTESTATLLKIGGLWVGMTVCFEFGFGHYLDRVPFEKLIVDYNIFKGNLWSLFLLILFVSPLIVKSIFYEESKNTTHSL